MRKLKFVGLLFCLVYVNSAQAQQEAFWEEIRSFKKLDSIQMPPRQAILFIGSSSFRMWKSVQQNFPGYTIINRGFGGSSLPDILRYAEEIIFPYHPKQIVIYCGENDLAASDTVTPELVAERFVQLFALIRSKMKTVNIVFVSIKPSPSRARLLSKVVKSNELIEAFLKTKRRAAYVNIFDRMLGPDGKPRQELFLDDMLHMNADGYALWQEALRPYLRKE